MKQDYFFFGKNISNIEVKNYVIHFVINKDKILSATRKIVTTLRNEVSTERTKYLINLNKKFGKFC